MLIDHLSAQPSSAFEKLVLSGLALRSETILTKFFTKYAEIDEERRSRLRTLKLGNLGLLDSQLMKITPLLEKFGNLEKVSLHSNKSLATGTGSGIRRFLNAVGRKCRVSYLSVLTYKFVQELMLISGLASGPVLCTSIGTNTLGSLVGRLRIFRCR